MNVHGLIRLVTAEGLDDVRPDGTGCTELRDLHEEIRAHRNPEENLAGRLLDGQAALHERPQIFHRHGENVGRILHIIGAAPAEDVVPHHDGAKARRILYGPLSALSHFIIELR